MANALNISSEEELLKLRTEGKITEDEYQYLLDAMRKAPPKDAESSAPQAEDFESKHKRGKIAFALMFVGLILPAICFFIVDALAATQNAHAAIAPWFFLGVAFQIVAFALGVSAWPDTYAKVTVVIVPLMAAFVLIIFLLTM